jgi:retron-type reverse transcriptase
MTLQATSLEWAIDFLQLHSDGDLFPKILEVEAISSDRSAFVSQLSGVDLSTFQPGSCRRFIVPKDDISYRQATQLDPQDSIILSALVYEYGSLIESRRLPSDKIFSYRFQPTLEDGLYSSKTAWNQFWTKADLLAKSSAQVLYCDIADFYNQIYHHTVENQLVAAGLPNQAVKWLIALLKSTTAGVSRGVPVGPHPIHLIAEATLIPIDNSLQAAGLNFIRYADDILIFCESLQKGKSALSTVVAVLDKQQRLMLQRHKTKFYDSFTFQKLCSQMIEDRPINSDEKTLLALIKKYTDGDPYKIISYAQITPDDWASISDTSICNVINDYTQQEPIDYIRLRWFYRRLAQIGHPGAIEISLDNIDKLGPCFANICFYLASIQSITPDTWKSIGGRLLEFIRKPEIQSSEYFRLLILSLFTRNEYINHFAQLYGVFQQSDAIVRREVILAAKANKAFDWARELKESFPTMDPWQQRAYLFTIAGLPRDEKKFFLARQTFVRPFEKALAKWVKGT